MDKNTAKHLYIDIQKRKRYTRRHNFKVRVIRLAVGVSKQINC